MLAFYLVQACAHTLVALRGTPASDPQYRASAQVLKQHPDAAGRLHDVPSAQLPRWVQIYFSGTRFWDTHADQWFVPMEGEDAAYPVRRGTIASLLAKGFTQDDVQKVSCSSHACSSLVWTGYNTLAAQRWRLSSLPLVDSQWGAVQLALLALHFVTPPPLLLGLQVASMLKAGATDDDLADAMVNIVNARFLNGTVIPKQVRQQAEFCSIAVGGQA